MPPIAGRVQRGRGFRQVLADDARVAHLLVGKRQFVVGEADRARIMSEVGMLERARMERNRPRLLAARERQPAMQPPQCGKLAIGNLVAERVGRTAERGGGLSQVILQQPGFGERRPNAQFVLFTQRSWPQNRRKNL